VKQHAVGEYPLGLYLEGTAELLSNEDERRAVEPLFKERLGATADILARRITRKVTILQNHGANWYAFGKFDGTRVRNQTYMGRWRGAGFN